MILIGIHGILFGLFLLISHQIFILTLIEIISITILILGSLIFFFTKNDYYLYFFTGIIISSIVISFVLPLTLIIIIPEIIFLASLTLKGPNFVQRYNRMKISKDSRLPYYDHSTVRMYNLSFGPPTSGTLGFRMDEIWNPDSAKSLRDEKEDAIPKNKYSMWKIITTSLVCTIGFLTTSLVSLIIFFKI